VIWETIDLASSQVSDTIVGGMFTVKVEIPCLRCVI